MSIINPYRFGSGAFSPTDIGSLVLWLDASDRGTTANQWDDKSGNSNHCTSASGNFPTFSAGVATFDGTDFLTGVDYSALSEGEIFYRVKSKVSTNTGLHSFGTSSNRGHYPFSDGNIYDQFGSTTRKSCGSPLATMTAFHTLNIWSAPSDWSLNQNGSEVFATASNTVAFKSAPRIGNSVNDYLNDDIKAVCLFGAKLSADDRASMNTYMDSL